MRNKIVRAILCTIALLPILLANSYSADPAGPVPGRFIVKLKPNVKLATAAKAAGKELGMTRAVLAQLSADLNGIDAFDRFAVVTTSDLSLSANDVLARLGTDLVESVEQDYYLEFFDFPTDPLFEQQWYLNNTGQEYLGITRIDGTFNDSLTIKHGTPGADIAARALYLNPPADTTKVTVAIVDSGIDTDHPEIRDKIWRNTGEIPDNGLDDDHNGFVDDVIGYDISGDSLAIFDIEGDNDPTDRNGHGTHIAGIVASAADGIGIAGVSPMAELMPVKIQPNATNSVGALGILYAVNSGAEIINISWGTPFESALLLQALRFARQNGVFVAIAAGNTGDNTRFFPAGFDSTFVVGAGNSDGFVTDFSTFGAHIDIVAPGLDILSLRAAGTDLYAPAGEPGVRIIGDDSLYILSDGTSMAAPMVCGAAALMRSFRPDLTLDRLEEILLAGATDLIDPYGKGNDTLVGPDTISGAGYLNIDESFSLLVEGGIAFKGIDRRRRYTNEVPIRIYAVDDYLGGWRLEYSFQSDLGNWQLLAEDTQLPADSVAYVYGGSGAEGIVHLRVVDDFGYARQTSFTYVTSRSVSISSPTSGSVVGYGVQIFGSIYGPDYDSLTLWATSETGERFDLLESQGEFFDSLIYSWAFSGTNLVDYTIYLEGHFSDTSIVDSTRISVARAFAQGWPQSFSGFGGMTPVCTDLDRDGERELVVPTTRGLYLFHADGQLADGWPVLPSKNMRSVPAIYDVDGDGDDEVICTNDTGIHVFHHDGTYADGWPQESYTGLIPYEYGYPNATVTQLGYGARREDSAIVIINKLGDIRAYQFDGTPYFFSLNGLFASLSPRISPTFGFGGSTSPFVTSAKVMGGDSIQVLAAYSAPFPYQGLGMFKGKNALPAVDTMESPLLERMPLVHGTVLGDLDLDNVPEIITVGNDTLSVPHIHIKKFGTENLDGWPKALPDVRSWISSYPVLADLDLDGVPEILISFFEFDRAVLYIFRADGTPYATQDGRPEGQAYFDRVTFGTPAVANLLGDKRPEIIMRTGFILPGTGPEQIYILDHDIKQIDISPITTLARPRDVFSSRFAPLVDDLDSDGRVELIIISDRRQVLVWDFPASVDFGRNTSKFLIDNLNSGYFKTDNIATDVPDEVVSLPTTPTLSQNYPNPFNPATAIRFSLPDPQHVSLDVFNLLGQRVTTLLDRRMEAGEHEVEFDGSGVASGIYFYRIKAGDFRQVKKMVMVQ